MTITNEPNQGKTFVRSYLPWLVGIGALAVYLLTLNDWISSLNRSQVAKLAGYSWQSEVVDPLYYVTSFPLRWLQPSWIPYATNVFSALCAALTLVLLARSVVLLPHDRTHDQRERELSEGSLLSGPLAWIPPLLAVLVCGLQMTFWERATNGTPEIPHLLFFAYVIRALLEFRLDQRDIWLYKAGLAYGILMTSDWIALGTFPALIAAIVWLKGLSFFNLRFLGRLLLFGLIGLSFFLLLPLIASLSKIEPLGFWQALKMNVTSERSALAVLPKVFPKNVFLLLSLTSILPIVLLSIRWASYFGDTSQLGVALTKLIFHIVHVTMLAACLWVMLDPKFSPRSVALGLPLLNLYFLSALSAGYFSGYFLVVFKPLAAIRGRRPPKSSRIPSRLATAVVLLLTVATPGILVIKNLPIIRETNHTAVKDFARLLVSSIPKNANLISDDPIRAMLARAWLERTGEGKNRMVVESWALSIPAYQRYLKQEYGAKWPVTENLNRTEVFESSFIIDSIKKLQNSNALYYLHPSFGYFFEHFYVIPHGLSYELKPFKQSELLPPPLAREVIQENDKFWEKARNEELLPILKVPEVQNDWRQDLFRQLRLYKEPLNDQRDIGTLYSRCVNYWGAAVQKTGDLEKAAGYFELAQQLNTNNVVATVNLEFNKKFRAGQHAPVEMPKNVEDQFGGASSWDQVMGVNGPYDEPNFCYAQGYGLVTSGLYRQAAQAFERVHAFAPDDIPSRLWLGQINLLARKPERTLELTRVITEDVKRFNPDPTNRIDSLSLQAKALFQKNEPERAIELLESAVRATPKDLYLLANAASVYSEFQYYSNAVINLDRQLQIEPDNAAIWLNKGYVSLQSNDCNEAVKALTRTLALETNALSDLHSLALLNRALAYLRCDKVAESKADYETLQKSHPSAYQIYFGLGDIALRQRDTNAAIQYYQSYLSNSVPGSDETQFVQNRLKELRGEKPSKP